MTGAPTCPACGADLVPFASACPACQAPVAAADDVTRLAAPVAQSGPPPSGGSRPGRAITSSTGWLSSSGAIDHGRFEPGTLLGGRYRIVGRLGKGGMGEVFRADDLKLGQPVALKFLPSDVDRDPARLTQLHTEVRMARQVSHPNVCRVYDIDEVDGHTFLSMEYVDGEDLASLLRRIGRFPEDRGLEIARQICAGLAAAHERGVVHRDFKPANVMLDGSGKVRITDFGLAGVTGESIRAGTPAYMAPEQLAGQEVTVRSDIYALGLVLYEVFTGQRALDGKNLADLIRKREQSEIVPPSALVRDLDPKIEYAVMRCLAPDPAGRPASALTVSGMLPGGDPLAAAMAAGETPSPEMVAAAGGTDRVPARTAILTAAWIALSLLALMGLYQRVMFVNRVPTPKTPEALQDRAVEALAKLGYTEPPTASASGLGFSLAYANFIASSSSDRDRWAALRAERPPAFALWYRTSPRPLIPYGALNQVVSVNPPLTVAGMTLIVVDASGRVAEFSAVPQPRGQDAPHPPVNWDVVFDVTDLPGGTFSPVSPAWVPTVYAEERRAWEGPLPGNPVHTLRVEAAAQAGRIVSIIVTGPWTRSARGASGPMPGFAVFTSTLEALIMPALMLAGVVLARRNVRLGRGDRRGAFRAGAFVFVTLMVGWVLGPHVMPPGQEVPRLFAAIGNALFDAGVLWVTYLGLEPYIRRHAPDTLIGWTRLLAGGWNDPRVGRDAMFGVAAGLAMTLPYAVHNVLPPLAGMPEPMPLMMGQPDLLLGGREVLAHVASRMANAIQAAMLCVVGYVALLLLLKRPWAAILAAVAIFTPVAINGMFPPGTPLLDLALGVLIIAALVGTVVRVGLLATLAALTTHFLLLRAPITTDLSSWRAPIGLWFVAIIAVVGLGACYVARYGTSETARG